MVKVNQDSLGGRLQKIRMSRGWTQSFLAEGICTPSMISQIESGKAVPSVELLKKVVEKLGVSASALLHKEDPDHFQAKMQVEIVKYYLQRRQYEEALQLVERLEGNSQLSFEQLYEVRFDKADALMKLRRSAEAIEFLEAIKQEIEQFPERFVYQARLYNLLGSAYMWNQDLLQAYVNYGQAHKISTQHPVGDLLKGMIEFNLGKVLSTMGQDERALPHFEIAKKYFLSLETAHSQLASTLYGMALSLYNENQMEQAEALFSQARVIYEVQNLLYMSQKVREDNAYLILSKTDIFEARQELLNCCIEFNELGATAQLVETYGKLASLSNAQGNISEADYYLKLADELPMTADQENDPRYAFLFRVKAEYFLAIKEYDKSVKFAYKSSGIFDKMKWVKEASKSLQVAAEAYHQSGEPSKAFEVSQKVIARLQENTIGV